MGGIFLRMMWSARALSLFFLFVSERGPLEVCSYQAELSWVRYVWFMIRM